MSVLHDDERFAALRSEMVQRQLRDRGIRDERLLAAMERVPRHLFVAEERWDEAYADHPVEIACGQTTSQPYMIATMLELLDLRSEHRVLEVGTGTGYEAALLAELAGQVFSIERHAELAAVARENLAHLGYANVTVVVGDGSSGLPQAAPFDRIVVAAAAPKIPEALVAQLAEGGMMAIPVGPPKTQTLQLVRKIGGETTISSVAQCAFVPLVRKAG